MYVVLAWFAAHPPAGDLVRSGSERFAAAAAPLVPDAYVRRRLGGADWGLRMLHAPADDRYAWPAYVADGELTAVSLGLPVGLDTAGGPAALARRLLAGGDVHGEVVPPFTLIALDGDRRFAIQQDWLGMGRLFTATAHGITAFGNRPSLLAAFLWGGREPDVEGWRSYTACGHFGGDSAPIRGVRLLGAGERVTGQRRPGGGWTLARESRRSVDDLVAEGLAAQAQGPAAAVDRAAEGMLATATGIADLYTGPLSIGLSGGKDSRVIAAAFLAAGRPVGFHTNVDVGTEGETAQRLMQIVRDRRGLEPPHRLHRVAAPENVLRSGLYERTERLHHQYDFQFPSSYVARPAAPRHLPVRRDASVSGVGGELAVAYWYPDDPAGDLDRDTGRATAIGRLNSAVPANTMTADAFAAEHARVAAIADRGEALGLRGQAVTDYVYLVERVRRWYSSAYLYGVVTPFLAPAFVSASFALTAAQKRQWALHRGLLHRFVPEWSEVPFFTGAAGTVSTAAAVWDGDGVRTMCDLLDRTGGPLTAVLRPDAVRQALASCVAGAPPVRRRPPLLHQFTCLAVATHTLLPDAVRDLRPRTYAELTRTPVLRPAARRLVRQTRLGRRVWSTLRNWLA